MNARQLNKAIEIATKDSKTIHIHIIGNISFSASETYCTWNVDEKNNLLIINDSFLKETIILDVNQITFIETKPKH